MIILWCGFEKCTTAQTEEYTTGIPGKKKKRRRAQGKRNARRNENDGRFVACIISINYEYEYKTLSNFVSSKVKITVNIKIIYSYTQYTYII